MHDCPGLYGPLCIYACEHGVEKAEKQRGEERRHVLSDGLIWFLELIKRMSQWCCSMADSQLLVEKTAKYLNMSRLLSRWKSSMCFKVVCVSSSQYDKSMITITSYTFYSTYWNLLSILYIVHIAVLSYCYYHYWVGLIFSLVIFYPCLYLHFISCFNAKHLVPVIYLLWSTFSCISCMNV